MTGAYVPLLFGELERDGDFLKLHKWVENQWRFTLRTWLSPVVRQHAKTLPPIPIENKAIEEIKRFGGESSPNLPTIEPPLQRSSSMSTETVLKEGFLSKRGQILKNWKLRWWVLRRDVLEYYKNPVDAKPKGLIRLWTANVMLLNLPEFGKRRQVLSVATPKRTYLLHAKTEIILQDWQKILHLQTERLKLEKRKDSPFDYDESSAPTFKGLLMVMTEKLGGWKVQWCTVENCVMKCYYFPCYGSYKHASNFLIPLQNSKIYKDMSSSSSPSFNLQLHGLPVSFLPNIYSHCINNKSIAIEGKFYNFQILVKGNTFLFSTDNKDQWTEWINALERVIFNDSLKVLAIATEL